MIRLHWPSIAAVVTDLARPRRRRPYPIDPAPYYAWLMPRYTASRPAVPIGRTLP